MSARSSAPISAIEELLAYGQGTINVACVLALAVLPPLALDQSGWVPGMERLVVLTLLATALGLLAARSGVRKWQAALLIAGGLAAALFIASNPLADTAQVGARLWQGVRRLHWWATVVWLGGSNDDPLVPMVFAGWALWLACVWLGWVVGSGRSAMAGALPIGVLLAANTFFTVGGWGHLVAFVALTMLLLAVTGSRNRQARCEAQKMQCDATLHAGSTALAVPVAAACLLAALALPPIASERVADAFWERAEVPWRRTVRLVKWLFPGLTLGAAASPWIEEGDGAAMPTARDLEALIDSSVVVVMHVSTSDPPPPPRTDHLGLGETLADLAPSRYWRGMTYDVYTGRGWANTRTDAVSIAAGVTVQVADGPRTQVAQQFQILLPREELLYTIAEPVALGDEVRVHWRGEGDLAYLKAPIGGYSVVSQVVDASQAELRSAGDDYPLWVRDRYLDIPEVPERVRQLALSLTAGDDNAFDRLLAIETYLRANFAYDLEVGEAAEGKDVVDFFLFESQRGFCDHYASAMVVLARLAGIPARLASGYATGTYDYQEEHYVVTSSQAHSWPEAYFPGFGWVEFEPTVSQSTIYRPLGLDTSATGQATAPAVITERRPAAYPFLGIGAALLAAGGLVWWLGRRRIPSDPVLRAYWGMQAVGARLQVAEAAATPREYAAALSVRARQLAPGREGDPDGLAATEAALGEVASAYEAWRYGRTNGRHDRPLKGWRRAERQLWLLAAREAPRALLREAGASVRRRLRR